MNDNETQNVISKNVSGLILIDDYNIESLLKMIFNIHKNIKRTIKWRSWNFNFFYNRLCKIHQDLMLLDNEIIGLKFKIKSRRLEIKQKISIKFKELYNEFLDTIEKDYFIIVGMYEKLLKDIKVICVTF